jgi:hypothetical protein
VTGAASLSPVVKYHGLARRYLLPLGFLMRPQLNGGTLGRPQRVSEFLLFEIVLEAFATIGLARPVPGYWPA